MMNIELKPITAAEVSTLAALSRDTFFTAFGHLNSVDDMEAYATMAFSHQKLSTELSTPGSCFFFAIMNDDITGFIKINTGEAQNEFQDRNSLEIERLYVVKQYQGKNIGSQMLDAALQMAIGQGCDMIWLGVWEQNSNAIRLYERQGFKHCGSHDFMLGTDRQTDLLMCRKLK